MAAAQNLGPGAQGPDLPLFYPLSSSSRSWETRQRSLDHGFPLLPNQIQVPAFPPRPPEPREGADPAHPSARLAEEASRVRAGRGQPERTRIWKPPMEILDSWDLSRCSSGVGKETGTERPQLLDCSDELRVAHLLATTGYSCASGRGGGVRTWT